MSEFEYHVKLITPNPKEYLVYGSKPIYNLREKIPGVGFGIDRQQGNTGDLSEEINI